MWTLAARRCLATFLVLAAAAPVRAQILFAPPPLSTLLDTSIRTAAMGGAGAAVFWGEPGVWANPGTLAGVNGVGWVTGHTYTLPGLDSHTEFSSQRLLIGGGGLGFSLMGKPISGLGKAEFERPSAFPLFNQVATLSDLTEGWGVGLSPLRVIEAVRRLVKASPRSPTTYGDITFGYQSKESRFQGSGFDFDEAATYDWGAGGRLALARWWGEDAPFRLDLSGAYSQVNVFKSHQKNPANAATIQFDRTAFALHLSPAPPAERSSTPPSLPWWRPGDVPELSLGLAYDHDERHDEPAGSGRSAIDNYGFEANVFRLLALRAGYVSDPDFGIEGWSYGGGLTLPIAQWGNVGYQLASVPTAEGLDRQFRQGWSVWLQPARILSGW